MDTLANGWVGSMDVIIVCAGISALDGLVAWTCAICHCMFLHAYRKSAAIEVDRPLS